MTATVVDPDHGASMTAAAARDLTDQIKTGMESVYHSSVRHIEDGPGPFLATAAGTTT